MAADKACSQFSLILSATALLALCLTASSLYGQKALPSTQAENAEKPGGEENFTVRVAVEEVRLDAVVLDNKGRPITDLTAEDFEIFQDTRKQQVLSVIYINNHTAPDKPAALPPKKSRSIASLPAPAPEWDKVNRTFVFVVDDISMRFEHLHYARMALNNFVEKQMQPGDLIAILRTGYGNSALQMFLSDKRALKARIEKVSWGANAGRDLEFDREHFNLDYVFESQLSTIRYSLRALENLPGRKALMLLTAKPTIPKPDLFSSEGFFQYYRLVKAYNQMADEAMRSGAVVHVLDIQGLMAPDENVWKDADGNSAVPSNDQFGDNWRDGLNPLPLKTGGKFIQGTNFFRDGIGKEVENMLKGYYLLSYAPPVTTFKTNRKNIYHRIRIMVKRKGASVFTRDGFYGVTMEEDGSPEDKNLLQEAIFSPFQHKGLNVSLASGFIDDAEAGYVLRSWIHLDARDVTIKEKPGEGHFADLETICLTSDISGWVHDSRMLRYQFRIREENLAWVREHGIRFSLLLPVKKAGAYYVRTAVKDMDSGKVGSAYQFLQIPDLKKDRLALSNIFVLNREEDAEWIRSGMTQELKESAFAPVLERNEIPSPALRKYARGDNFRHMAVLYNAKNKKGEQPDLEVQSILYHDGAEIFKSEFKPLALKGVKNFDRIPIIQKLTLGSALTEGDYVLELLARDKRRKEKDGLTSQALDFQISAK